MKPNLLRKLPAVDTIFKSVQIMPEVEQFSRLIVVQTIRTVLADIRTRIKNKEKGIDISVEAIGKEVIEQVRKLSQPSLKPLINATGTVLHTNFGRAILCKEAIHALHQAASTPVNLEYDIETADRGDRDNHIESLLCKLTGAQSATVVNNNAAAVLLSLNTLAQGKEVIVSRGELIEIGGTFRLPEIMQKSGCILVEVGTTNRTHLEDYKNAITKNTVLLLKAHTSNYRIVGFTAEVNQVELCAIGTKFKIPVMVDLGSGALVDLSKYGLPKEITVQEIVNSGADIVTFSGDKLLGGPQAGLIVGKKKYIDRIKKNPLKRALRVDKLTIAALEATLKLYLNEEKLAQTLPTLYWLTRPLPEIEKVANEAAEQLKFIFGNKVTIKVTDGYSEVGSGALPEEKIPTKLITLVPIKVSVQELASVFRKNNPPIIGRIHAKKFILDPRCIPSANLIVPKVI
ncbi:MAG: L-seryl-tRNA(Sec) selenium transferase [bacterium]|nr:L-seryl-tRNA(Sec) selenium transferase [bacterium]